MLFHLLGRHIGHERRLQGFFISLVQEQFQKRRVEAGLPEM